MTSQAEIGSAEPQPDSPVPTTNVAKHGGWKQSPALLGGRAAAGPAGAAATMALPPSPFSLVPSPPSTAACDRLGIRSSLTDGKTIESRHSGGGAATDSASSDATQLAAVHAVPVVGLTPESRSRSGQHGAAWGAAAPAGSRQWGMSALPDGLSGLLDGRKPERAVEGRQTARPQLRDSAMSRVVAQETASVQQRSAADPAMAVIAAATAALNLAAERLLLAGGRGQLAALPQGSAGLAAAAAAAAHLTLHGASPSEAADKILAMVTFLKTHVGYLLFVGGHAPAGSGNSRLDTVFMLFH